MPISELLIRIRPALLPVTCIFALAACDSSASGRARSHPTHSIVQEDDGEGDEATAATQNCGPAPNPGSPTPTFHVSQSGSGPGHFTTLSCAIQAALRFSLPAVQKVTILVAPGTYTGEQIDMEARTGMPAIAIAPQNAGTNPVFQDDGNTTWLTVRGAVGDRTPFSITGLVIRNYVTAISLHASRTPGAPWIGGFTVTDSRFENIGEFTSGVKYSTAAIRFVNSRYNDFENNAFSNIHDIDHCEHLHAFYMAHFSSFNVVRNNTFDNECGDPIRVRDSSNSNQITGNNFSRQDAKALFADWFCNGSRNRRCTADHEECPSQGNVFADNTYRIAPGETPPQRLEIAHEGEIPGCAISASDYDQRVRESGTRFVNGG